MSEGCRVRVTGPLTGYVAGFREELAAQGYTVQVADRNLRMLAHVSRWMSDHGFSVAELTAERLACRKVFLRLNAPITGLTTPAVTSIVYRACRRAGQPRAGAHRLRHSAATAMLAGGASLTEIGQVLRHARQETSAIYAKVDRTALRCLARPWPGGAT
jgi:site-specific recombinase XerD